MIKNLFSFFLLILFIVEQIPLNCQNSSLILKFKKGKRKNFHYYQYLIDKNIMIEKQIFKNISLPETIQIKKFNKYIPDITEIYELNTREKKFDLHYLINKLNNKEYVEYVEEKIYPKIFYEPNDPGLEMQYYLINTYAKEGWDLYKGDTNVIIGIVDTGTEILHNDLFSNLKINYNDPIDGVDNDNDGFIDNYWGWDLANNDNSPNWNDNTDYSNNHGVLVAGICCATPNNNFGIAGIGFNTKYLPIKVMDSLGIMSMAYEGIVYASLKNSKIINCSWGSPIYTRFGKDIINFVTYGKNSLIISAAGNDGNTLNNVYYPCAYENVLCVAATNQNNTKWLKSCYGFHIDVCAPGEAIYTTYPNNSFGLSWGTSFAAPIVAGQAALIYGLHNKSLHPLQIMAIIKETAIPIDTLPENAPFSGLLGNGLINIKNSLSSIPYKSIHLSEYNTFENFDTIYLNISCINLFSPLKNLTISINDDPDLTFISQNVTIGEVDSLSIFETSENNCFKFLLNDSNAFDIKKDLELIFNDTNFNFKKKINLKLKNSYLNLVNNNTTLTICANGLLGYNDYLRNEGEGLKYYTNESLISSMGLIALDKNKFSTSLFNYNHFKPKKRAQIFSYDNYIKVFSEFTDELNPCPIGINIKLEASSKVNEENIIELKYTISNNSNTIIDSCFFGLFIDPDIYNPNKNFIRYDSLLKIIYAENSDFIYRFIAIYSPNNPKNYYAIDNDGANNSICITDGVNHQELKYCMQTQRLSAGYSQGNDVSFIVSYGPFTLNVNDSLNLKFIIFLAKNKQELSNTILNFLSQDTNYIYIKKSDKLIELLNNIGNEIAVINKYNQMLKLELFDLLNRKVKIENLHPGKNFIYLNDLNHGTYLIKIYGPDKSYTFKIIKI